MSGENQQQPAQQVDLSYNIALSQMNTFEVSFNFIEKFRNFLIQTIPNWYAEIKIVIDNPNNPNFMKYYYMRALSEMYTTSRVTQPQLQPTGIGREIDNVFRIPTDINAYVFNLQKQRYCCLLNMPENSFPPQGSDPYSDVGFLRDEAEIWFMIWKKKNRKREFFENHLAPFWKSEYKLIDGNLNLNFTYWKFIESMLENIGTDYVVNLGRLIDSDAGLTIWKRFNLDILPTCEWNAGLYDFRVCENPVLEASEFESFINALNLDLNSDYFLNNRGGAAQYKKSVHKTCLENAALKIQDAGEVFIASNISEEYFKHGKLFADIQDILVMKNIIFNTRMEEDDAFHIVLNQLNLELFEQFDMENYSNQPLEIRQYIKDTQNAIKRNRLNENKDLIKECYFHWQEAGSPEAWMDKQIEAIRMRIESENSTLRKKLLNDWNQAKSNENTEMVKAINTAQEEAKKEVAKIDKINNDDQVKKWITAYLKKFNPEITTEQINEKIKSFGPNATIDEIKRQLDLEETNKNEEWEEVVPFLLKLYANLELPIKDQNGAIKKVPMIKDAHQLTPEEQDYVNKRIRSLSTKTNGDAQKAKDIIKSEYMTKVPEIQDLISSQTEQDKIIWRQSFFTEMLNFYNWDVSKWYDFFKNIYPKVKKVIHYNVLYVTQNSDFLTSPDSDHSAIIEVLDKKIAEYDAKKSQIMTDEVRRKMTEFPDFVTEDELAGHVENAKDAIQYIHLKDIGRKHLNKTGDLKDIEYNLEWNNLFFHESINGVLEKINKYFKQQDPNYNIHQEQQLQQSLPLPKNILDDLKYYNGMNTGLLKDYFDVEREFSVLQKINPLAATSKNFEEYIIKSKNSHNEYSSNKQCFENNVKAMTESAKIDISNFKIDEESYRNAKYNKQTGEYKGEWDLDNAVQLWNDVIGQPVFNSNEDAIYWLRKMKGKNGVGGISFLIHEAASKERSMTFENEAKAEYEKWKGYQDQGLVRLWNWAEMEKILGGKAKVVAFLKKISEDYIRNTYNQYYRQLDLKKYFDRPQQVANNKNQTIDANYILAEIGKDVSDAKTTITDMKKTWESTDTGRVNAIKEINKYLDQNQKISEQPWDWQNSHLKYNGDRKKMKAEFLLHYHNAVQQYNGAANEMLNVDEVERRVERLTDKELAEIETIVDEAGKFNHNKIWWNSSKDVINFISLASQWKVWNDAWVQEYSKMDKNEIYKFMTTIIEKQIYPKVTGEDYKWKNNKTQSAVDNFQQIYLDTMKEIGENNELEKNSTLKQTFESLKGSTGYSTYRTFRKAYQDETKAIQFLERINQENDYRNRFNKQSISYPEGDAMDDAAKIDWLKKEIKVMKIV